MQHVCIILPTFNESRNIVKLIPAIFKVVSQIKGFRFSILVVDDRSPDQTGEKVRTLMKKYPTLSLLEGEKKGLGAAYVRGMHHAVDQMHADLIMQMDADWSHNPDLLPLFIKHITQGSDFAIGSRYIKGGAIPGNWGMHRKIFSVIGNLWVRFGLGMLSPHDWSSGFRIMKAAVFQKVSNGLEKYSGYTFQIAFLHRVKQEGYMVSEIPLVFVDRVHGKSKFPASEYIKNVILYVLNNSTLLKYLVVGVIGFSIQTLLAQILIMGKISEGLSVSAGAFCAICTNFIANNWWTFAHKKISGWSTLFRKFIHFLGTSIGAVIIQGVVVEVGVYFLGSSAWFPLMVFAIIFLVIPYNYFIYNRFIWKTHER